MIYANGIRINISDIVRLTFLEGQDNTSIKPVSEMCMQFDTLKMLHNSIGKAISEHEANVAQMQENARKAH